jgi:hypothetical protein
LGDAVVIYLEDIKKTKKHKTYAAYKIALEYFLESCTKARVTEISRSDLLQYSAYLRDAKKLQPRTVYNKFESIMSFLKTNGIRGPGIMKWRGFAHGAAMDGTHGSGEHAAISQTQPRRCSSG